jgi:hypothetical protein
MTSGVRTPAQARQRSFAHPQIQACWQALDCGFTQVADVFEECAYEALAVLDKTGMAQYLDAARWLGKLGRGAEPMLAFLEEWPAVVAAVGKEALPPVLEFVQALQKSPNGKAIAPFLQTLAAVARRLQSLEQLQHYLDVARELMARTTGSIHGRHATLPSPGLPVFFEQAPRVLDLLSIGDLRNWVAYGIRHYRHHPERQEEYFALKLADSKAVLQRERRGTLFADVERQLELYLRALWQDEDYLVPYSTAFDELRKPMPYYDKLGLRVPDVFEDAGPIAGIDRYRALLAHMAGHRRWSAPQIADNWSPFQRMAVEFFEDCRIDLLAARAYPGLARIFRALHPKPAEDACDPATTSCLRHRLAMFSRACLDPDHGYRDADLNEFVRRFHACLAEGPSSTAAMAELALAYVAQTRRQSDQFARVHFDDTEIDYRDDNRHLWIYIEDSDDEEFFDQPDKTLAKEAEVRGLPPRHYPEWDYSTQSYRPDWASVYEALHPGGNPADVDRLLAKHAALAKRLKRLLDLMKPQEKVRIRYQEEGSELDLDVAIRSLIDLKAGGQPEMRINMSHRTDGRNIAVLLLVDLSESLNGKVSAGGTAQTILELSQEAVALLAWAIDRLGDPLAIAGFHSNTRHEVRYRHIKGFSEGWSDAVKARIAAMAAGYSTRMGAAIRHAGRALSARRADKRLLLVLTDGEPADIDVTDPEHLRADAKKAVAELDAQGIAAFCLSLDPKADDYVRDIFGKRWRVLDRIERLPEQLPMLYLALTK